MMKIKWLISIVALILLMAFNFMLPIVFDGMTSFGLVTYIIWCAASGVGLGLFISLATLK